jgi:uncharacterized repeat protein (TIGR02543 family)
MSTVKNKWTMAAVALLLMTVSCKDDEKSELSVDKTTIDAGVAGGSYTVAVTANVPWTVTGSSEWCTASPTSGNGNGTITVAAVENKTANARTTTLSVGATGVTAKTVTVTQAAAATYTVTFNTNGGSAVTAVSGVLSGQTISPLPTPTKDNNVFDGWFSNVTLTTPFTIETPVTADITLYAKWKSVTYTVTFNSNGGSTVESLTVEHGETVASLPVPTKTDRVFDGWFSNASLTTSFTTETAVTANITVYAKWTIAEWYVYDKTGWEITAISDEESTSPGSKIIDGIYDNVGNWCSNYNWEGAPNVGAPLPHWVIINMKEQREVARTMTQRLGNGDWTGTKSFQYFVSDDPNPDATTWVKVIDDAFETKNTGWGVAENSLTSDAVAPFSKGQYLKLLLPDSFISGNINSGLTAVCEIDVYGLRYVPE